MVSAMCDPMKPAAPVTRTRMTAANHVIGPAETAAGLPAETVTGS